VNEGFGATIGSIGIIIIAGVVIGTFLERSGGAYALAQRLLRLIGPKRLHGAMAFIGYVVSIPVFADSGFIIMSSLNKALTKQAGLSLAGTAIALSVGLTATHTMVPPTPGPIAAAGILEADLGTVILIGLITSSLALLVTVIFVKRLGRRFYIDPAPELDDAAVAERLREAPSPVLAFLPIVVPIILIVLRSFADYPTQPLGTGWLATWCIHLGNPVVALLIGMLLAFLLPRRWDRQLLSTSGWVGEALTSAAIIILITGAGGAFGKVLQTSDLGALLEDHVAGLGLGLWLPFLVAAAMKTAQGSSTVALITTASIVAPLLPGLGLEDATGRALVVIAIGAGSAVVSHANDSFFWVVTQLSHMDVRQGYRLQSVGTGLLGFIAIIVLSLLQWLFFH
ncbi:MAG: GntP family permease, partial [Lewinella sp.]|nr:GntP family permease [Lewinella sp.]